MKVVLVMVVIGAVINFGFNWLKWKSVKKRIGSVKYQWSSRLDLRIARNRIYLGFLVAYLAVSFYFLFSAPKTMSNYTMPAFFVLVMSFAPRWNVAIGANGIALGIRTIPNAEIVAKKLVEKGSSRFLEIKWASATGGAILEEKSIPCPFRKLDI